MALHLTPCSNIEMYVRFPFSMPAKYQWKLAPMLMANFCAKNTELNSKFLFLFTFLEPSQRKPQTCFRQVQYDLVIIFIWIVTASASLRRCIRQFLSVYISYNLVLCHLYIRPSALSVMKFDIGTFWRFPLGWKCLLQGRSTSGTPYGTHGPQAYIANPAAALL